MTTINLFAKILVLFSILFYLPAFAGDQKLPNLGGRTLLSERQLTLMINQFTNPAYFRGARYGIDFTKDAEDFVETHHLDKAVVERAPVINKGETIELPNGEYVQYRLHPIPDFNLPFYSFSVHILGGYYIGVSTFKFYNSKGEIIKHQFELTNGKSAFNAAIWDSDDTLSFKDAPSKDSPTRTAVVKGFPGAYYIIIPVKTQKCSGPGAVGGLLGGYCGPIWGPGVYFLRVGPVPPAKPTTALAGNK